LQNKCARALTFENFSHLLQKKFVKEVNKMCVNFIAKAESIRDLWFQSILTLHPNVATISVTNYFLEKIVETGILKPDQGDRGFKLAGEEVAKTEEDQYLFLEEEDRSITDTAHVNIIAKHMQTDEQDRDAEIQPFSVHVAAAAQRIFRAASAPIVPEPGMRVRAISSEQGAPSGKTAMLIPPGTDLEIHEVTCQDGVWYASSTLYTWYYARTHAHTHTHTHEPCSFDIARTHTQKKSEARVKTTRAHS
jgi:hypothetical protein